MIGFLGRVGAGLFGREGFRKFWALDFQGALLVALVFVVLPNSFLSGVASFSGVGRPGVNLDYCIPLLFMLLGLKRAGILMLFFVAIFDLLLILGQLFPFIRLGDVFYLGKFFLFSSVKYHFLALLVFISLVAICFLLHVCWGRMNRRFSAFLCGLMLFFSFVDFRVEDGLRDVWRFSSEYFFSSQIRNFVEYRSGEFFKGVYRDGEPFRSIPEDASAVSFWRGVEDEQTASERLLLIVVESWGVPRQPEIQRALLRPLQAVIGEKAAQGVLSFDGVTVGAEFRELCQLSPNHFNFASVSHGFDHCLPNRLRARGYRTLAMHGAVGSMYDRRYWYPRAGFDESIFYESKAWPSHCYSFPGACDLDMMTEVVGYFSGEGKRFMYWLTLNSHSMYDERDIRVDAFDCAAFDISSDSRACRYLKLQAQFFVGLGEALKDKDMRGVNIMLVGDHRPLLIESQNHRPLFEFAQVPWLSFVVN